MRMAVTCSYLRDEKNRSLYGMYLKENPDPEVVLSLTVHA